MRHGFSRRQWLAGLLPGLGGFWLRRLWPTQPSAAAAATPSPPLTSPALRMSDALGCATTYVYDCAGQPLVLPAQLTMTTFTYASTPRRS
jgi:hypothetical protein